MQVHYVVPVGIPCRPTQTPSDTDARKLIHWRLHINSHTANPIANQNAFEREPSTTYDTSKNTTTKKTRVDVSWKDKTVNSHAKFHQAYRWIGDPITADQLITLFEEIGLHRYDYDENKSGCLTWVQAVLTRLEERQKIAAGSAAAFNTYVIGLRSSATDFWIPEDHGTFFQ